MKKLVFISCIALSLFGCGTDWITSQSTNNNESSSSNNGSIQLPTESVIDISSGSASSDNPAPENALLYTISSHITQSPTYDSITVDYSLTGSYNSTNNISMKENIANMNNNIKDKNRDNDSMRHIIKQQIDFNKKAKENNYKPISENNTINYKTVPNNRKHKL